MRTYFAVLVVSAIASFLLTPLVRRLAFALGAIDMPAGRKIHAEPMPRMGGLAVFLAFCVPWLGLYLLDNRITAVFQSYEKLFLALVLGSTAMLLLGIYDDLHGANAGQKFTIQVGTSIALFFAGFRIDEVSNPFGPPLQLGWLALPASVLWLVGVTNAINLLDGIDGLAAGVTALIALSLAVINIIGGNILVALLTLCLAGACLGFLPYNFAPARIFLGDTGSLFLGFTLACIGLISLFKGTTASLVFVPVILFGLPLFDTTSVILGRLQRRQPLFQADKSHVHHRLLKTGFDQKQTAFFLYCITLFLGALAVTLSVRQVQQDLLTIFALIVILSSIWWLKWRRLSTPPIRSTHAHSRTSSSRDPVGPASTRR